MLKNMIRHWKVHKLGFFLLFIGYLIAILIMSVGASWLQSARHEVITLRAGYPDVHLIELSMMELNDLPHDEILETVATFDHPLELHIRFYHFGLEDYEETIVQSIHAHKRPDWLPPLISGRHFTQAETQGNEPLAVIGKDVAAELFPEGLDANSRIHMARQMILGGVTEFDYEFTESMDYQVIGIIGHEDHETVWDKEVYLPHGSIPEGAIFDNEKSMMNVRLLQDRTFPEQEADLLVEQLKKTTPSIHASYSTNEPMKISDHNIWMDAMAIMGIAGLVLVVAMVNVVNLVMFWMLERRKEIVIRKAVGATDLHVFISILIESIVIALMAGLLAVTAHYLYSLFSPTLIVTWVNWLFAIITALICGIITSIIPTRRALAMQPAEVLNHE